MGLCTEQIQITNEEDENGDVVPNGQWRED